MKKLAFAITTAVALAIATTAAGATRPSPPTITGPNATTAGRHTYVFSSLEKGVPQSRLRFRCALDSTALHLCARRVTFALAAGKHVLRAQAVDPAGRRSAVSSLRIVVQSSTPALAVTKAWDTKVTTQVVGDLFGVALGPDGNVYVSDAADDTIEVYDSGGNHVRRWGSQGAGAGQFQFEKNPDPHDAAIAFSSIGVDARTGAVYVAESQRVQKFDPQGGFQLAWGSAGTDNGKFTRIADLTVGSDGTVYVLEDRPDAMGRVQEFDGQGGFKTTFGRGQIVDPGGIALDGAGDVIVADDLANRIRVFGADGTLLRSLGQAGSKPGQLDFPTAMDAVGGALYVADSKNNRVVRFDLASGSPTGYWQTELTSGEPVGLAIDPSGAAAYVVSELGVLTKYRLR